MQRIIKQGIPALNAVKPYEMIPRISRLKMIARFLPGGKYHGIGTNGMFKSMNEEFGDIAVLPSMFGKPEIVFVFNANDFETVFRNEGLMPTRNIFEILTHFRDKIRPDIYGGNFGSPLTNHGKRWYDVRTVTNPMMLVPKNVNQYGPQLSEIAKDFIDVIRSNGNEFTYDDLKLWAFESVANISLERRLGSFDRNGTDETVKRLIELVDKFLLMATKFELEPTVWKVWKNKSYQDFVTVCNEMLDIITNYMDETIRTLAFKSDESEKFLYKLLKIDKNMATIIAIDFMMAGIDTTSSIMSSIFYCLAKNPEKQQQLREEILKAASTDPELSYKTVQKISYLHASVREGLRLYPVTVGTGRESQNDLVLSGYQVPKGKNVNIYPFLYYRNEKFFPNSNEFRPERWIQGSSDFKFFFPFGFGVRSCLGQRFAMMEMKLLMVNLLKDYKIEWASEDDLQIQSVLINLPGPNTRFKITEI